MRIRAIICACVLLAAAVPALAANLDGKWTGSIDTPNGPVEVVYNFKTEGHKLSGTASGPNDSLLPLKDGKVDGNDVSFSLDISFGADPMTFHYTGVVMGNELKLHTDVMGQPLDFTLKKAS